LFPTEQEAVAFVQQQGYKSIEVVTQQDFEQYLAELNE
jgi:hypothetical protein